MRDTWAWMQTASPDELGTRRHSLDYPTSAEDFADVSEATRAIRQARDMLDSARTILDTGELTNF
ncbi:MAG: hypothetical protein ACRDP4_10285 [Nocardioidaceae bacterium]